MRRVDTSDATSHYGTVAPPLPVLPVLPSSPVHTPPPPLLQWVALCAAGEAIGMTAAAAAAKASQALAGDAPTGPAVALALSLVVAGGLIEGLALGAAQAAGLRRWLSARHRRRWVLVTVAIAGLGWAAASAPAVVAGGGESGGGGEPPWLLVLVGGAALGATMGAVLGAAQALVLRGQVRHPWRWVGANVLAWFLAMAVIFLGATTPAAGWPAPAVVALGTATGLAAGATLGLVSGWFLPSLAGPPPHNRLVLSLLRSPAHGLLDRSLVGLRVRGAVSGERFELPVTYATDGTGGLGCGPGPAGHQTVVAQPAPRRPRRPAAPRGLAPRRRRGPDTGTGRVRRRGRRVPSPLAAGRGPRHRPGGTGQARGRPEPPAVMTGTPGWPSCRSRRGRRCGSGSSTGRGWWRPGPP
ncbi:MAG TPA: hypothetical protein VFM55_17900 [Micromonosporaceae bacterium]|nr:hypothetical protein [Micromonosporaceae bacterium]